MGRQRGELEKERGSEGGGGKLVKSYRIWEVEQTKMGNGEWRTVTKSRGDSIG